MNLLVDNYDSFSYNLFQIAGQFTPEITVIQNDEYTVSDILAMNPEHIILSPGPGHPKEAGICIELVQRAADRIPILGVCLGHQAICEAFGAEIEYAKTLMHGKQSIIHIANGAYVFRGLSPFLTAGRYHSLAVKRDTLPDELHVIAETDDGEVMGVKHRDFPVFGVQFHPESILTPEGIRIIKNFLCDSERGKSA